MTTATNRQKKLLTFFGLRFSPSISIGAAGWEISAILADDANRERWRRYLFVTKDFDSDSPLLKPYDAELIESVEIPEDWSSSAEIQKLRQEIVSDIMSDGSPYDAPAPEVRFEGCSFMFTGKFAFGSRKACQAAVVEAGGSAPSQKNVSREIDYLVIGAEGSTAWKRGSYGNKIEAAILARREHGCPAIVSEEHWQAAITKG